MNPLAKWKVVTYMVALFAAGAVTGSVVSYRVGRRAMNRPHAPADYLRARYDKLGLSPEQAKKIEPMIEAAGAQLRKEQADYIKRIHQIKDEFNGKIASELTPEQNQKLDEMDRQRHEEQERRELDRKNDRKKGKPQSDLQTTNQVRLNENFEWFERRGGVGPDCNNSKLSPPRL
jgi:hypothetical protein